MLSSMCMIAQAAAAQMLSMGLNIDQISEAMHAVCDANDTKCVDKVAPNVKANANNKGDNFVSPEPRLQMILDNKENFYE